jgi:hypothetical protein
MESASHCPTHSSGQHSAHTATSAVIPISTTSVFTKQVGDERSWADADSFECQYANAAMAPVQRIPGAKDNRAAQWPQHADAKPRGGATGYAVYATAYPALLRCT